MTIVLDKYDYHMVQNFVQRDLTKLESANDLTIKQIADLIEVESLERNFVCAISLSNLYYLIGIYRVWMQRENETHAQPKNDDGELNALLTLKLLIPDISYQELLSFADLRNVQVEYITFSEFVNSTEEVVEDKGEHNDGREEKDGDGVANINGADESGNSDTEDVTTTSALRDNENSGNSSKEINHEKK